MKDFLDSLPPHECALTLEHDPHKSVYETVAQYAANLENRGCAMGWVSDEQRVKAIELNEMWTIQWYPRTPISFYWLAACDLDALLAEAREVAKQSG